MWIVDTTAKHFAFRLQLSMYFYADSSGVSGHGRNITLQTVSSQAYRAVLLLLLESKLILQTHDSC